MRTLRDAINSCDLIVFDVDGVFYLITRDIEDAFAEAVVDAAMTLAPGKLPSREQGIQWAWESWKKYGCSTKVIAEKCEIPEQVLHNEYLKNPLKLISLIPVDPELSGKFGEFKNFCESNGKSYAILSHGTFGWIYGLMEHQGLSNYFDEDQINDSKKSNGKKKSKSTEPFDMILDKKKPRPKFPMMLDDDPRNLVMAKKAGMITVLVTHGKKIDPKEYPHVDYMVKNLHQFFGIIIELKLSSVRGRSFSRQARKAPILGLH